MIIGAPALAGAIMLLLPFVAPFGERSARLRPWAVGSVMVSLLAVAVLLGKGVVAPWSPDLPVPQMPQAVTQPLSGDALQGAQTFQSEACIACHRMDGTGGLRGPDLTHVGARLTTEQLKWRILYGGPDMPAYGQTLQPDRVNALVAFLEQRK